MLEADSIRLERQNRTVLSGVYVQMEVGKTVALLGASGCGKTSLLLKIYGLLRCEGMVRVNGMPEPKLYQKPHLLRMLPQDAMTPGSLRVDMVLRHFEVLKNTFLTDFPEYSLLLKSRFSMLSGGERRVVELYCLLRQKSPYLLLDEPFRGISPVTVERFARIMTEEASRKAILFTDHQPERAHSLSAEVRNL